ncbi:hypothetical protein J31TS4_14550 [Paenibacillus sp. J31TS4]|uniref:LuxR C-terminal-related transcriptional regulator n=1 Tax=Paenibacillus sp. J31TS4 TaxID=2807195 RepID=UPI001B0D764D|nr:LuxR C-terminal-related transcriptional regulator [Paenibacillus sp. J31TS4]GIP38175.1 hypothetical protein J31TS4_14550 [Paenibacillus sp. J31TS4]
MSLSLLSTKLHLPHSRSRVVPRPRLLERLEEGLHRKLTLLSAPAGYGKTTLASGWAAACGRPAAWLSLDEEDREPARLLTCLVAAMRTIAPHTGEGVLGMLRAPQPPPLEAALTIWLNELAAMPDPFLLVLDDYHVLQSEAVDRAIALVLERMPPQMHLVLATREDPHLPLARLRVRDQLTEVRAADLRFGVAEAAAFLEQVMGLALPEDTVALLEARTEGWAAGLQLAALTLRDGQDPSASIRSFTGTHPFVLDYLMEEVLQRQSAETQTFLLRTSILERMCGSLCEAVLNGGSDGPFAGGVSGEETLAALEQANLFVVPLDNERRWYRYHHLFADLLRKRLAQNPVSPGGKPGPDAAELHGRASGWYEANGMELEAFRHAAAARDYGRAARLAEGGTMPLIFRGAVVPVRQWLDSLPAAELEARPSLLVLHASALLMEGRSGAVEPKLELAERALQHPVPGMEEDQARDLIGHIASIRATLAVSRHRADTILAESRRALAHLHPGNLPVRTAVVWTLGYACQLQGDRAAAGRAYAEALAASERIGHTMITLLAALGLGNIQEADTLLAEAAESYRRVLVLAGEPPLPAACEAHLGLARIARQQNDRNAALRHGREALRLARMFEDSDRAVAAEGFLARLELTGGEVSAAAALLASAEHTARRHGYDRQLAPLAAVRVELLLRQGRIEAASELAQQQGTPVSRARVLLAEGNAAAALAVLEPLREEAEARDWRQERLEAVILLAMARHRLGETGPAQQLLADALAMGEPGGFVRLFLDEGPPMRRLLTEAAAHGRMSSYAGRLLAAWESVETSEGEAGKRQPAGQSPSPSPPASAEPVPPLLEPLTKREAEVLRLIALGLSNQEIGARLYLALSTVKGYNRILFDKLQVKRRTEAVARAQLLGLL